jgi:hypothetical protein
MYDVYTNGRELLVIPRGQGVPIDVPGSWRKKKRIARSVSVTIRDDIRQYGYHRRKLVEKAKQTQRVEELR